MIEVNNSKKASINNIKDICEIIWYLEKKYDLLDWEIDGVKIWQHLRMNIYCTIAEKTGVLENGHPVNLEKKSFMDKMIFSFNIFVNFLFNNLYFKPLKVDIIIFSVLREKLIDNKYDDVYTKFLFDEFKKGKIRCFRVYHYLSMNILKNNKTTYLDFNHLFRNRNSFKNKLILTNENRVKIKDLNIEINNIFGINLDLRLIFKQNIVLFKENYALYKRLFLKKRPKKIFIICSYGKGSIIKAAKDLNIEVIELQHGNFSLYHLGYSFPERDKELDYFPDKFYFWGSFWSELINFPLKQENIVNYGFQYLRYTRNQYNHIERKANQIVVLSQGSISDKLISILEKNIDKLKDYKIIYKLHPDESINEYMSRLSDYNNVEIIKNKDLYQIFAESAYAIGIYSTAVYEGIAFGCKPILVDIPGIEYMEKIIKDYNIPVLTENADIIRILKEAYICNINPNDFY